MREHRFAIASVGLSWLMFSLEVGSVRPGSVRLGSARFARPGSARTARLGSAWLDCARLGSARPSEHILLCHKYVYKDCEIPMLFQFACQTALTIGPHSRPRAVTDLQLACFRVIQGWSGLTVVS